MNTLFTVTCHKGSPQEKSYSIDLGVDILDGVDDGTIRKLASQALTIQVQGKLRKKDNDLDIANHLQATYPDAIVSVGVVKTASLNSQLKALEKVIGKEALAKMIEEQLAGTQ